MVEEDGVALTPGITTRAAAVVGATRGVVMGEATRGGVAAAAGGTNKTLVATATKATVGAQPELATSSTLITAPLLTT